MRSDALSLAEIDGQYVELLPARTVLTLIWSPGGKFYGCGNNGGAGGVGGDAGSGGNSSSHDGTGGNANGGGNGGNGGDAILNKDVDIVQRGKGTP